MKNFYDAFAASAARFAARPAIEVQRTGSDAVDRFSYADLERMAASAAAFAAGRGLRRGDRAAILADNDARWCAAYLGVLRLGAVAVPLDTAYKSKQVAALLRDSSARIVFTTPKYLGVAREAIATAGTNTEAVLLAGSDSQVQSLEKTFAQPVAPALSPCPAAPEDPAVTLYTSGTTSDPKGVVLTHANLLAEKEAVFQIVPVDERDTILGVLPLFHALAQMANLLLPFSIGAKVVFLETVNSTELLRALHVRGVTVFACVPQFFYLIHGRVKQQVAASGAAKRLAFRRLLALNGWLRERAGVNLGPRFFRRVHDVLGREMRLLVTGGSRLDPAIGRDLYRMGFTLRQAYGLTETSGAACVTRGGRYTESVGPPLPGVEVKIAPSERATGGEEARDGEVLLRGPIIMQGYFNRPEANAEALAGGWLHTGDLGYLDARGELHITGRSKEVIVLSSGKNIYPEEIEAHYQQSPYIKELCVMGLARPGEPAAERLHAVVVPNLDLLRERKILNAREILRYEIEGLSIHLPSHKRILGYEIWTEELPRTTTRKLKRFLIEKKVRERAAAAGEESAEAPPGDADLAWMNQPEVARALAVVRAATKNAAAVRPDANIELDLGLDSMERVELLTHLESLFGTKISEEAAHGIYTVRELVEACLPKDASGAGAASGAGRDAWSALLVEQEDPELAALLAPRPVFSLVVFCILKLCYALARLLFRFRVSRLESLSRAGPFLICPNHQSYIDPFLVASALPYSVFRRMFIVGASEYFATPLMRWVAQQAHLIPVDPDANLIHAMQAGAYGLRKGLVLILFPEGERSIDGSVKKFKKGASILSQHLGVPIVPIALDGVHEVWPRGRSPQWRYWLPFGPGRVRMRIGAPLAPQELLPASTSLAEAESNYSAAAEKLRSVVLEMWDGLRQQA